MLSNGRGCCKSVMRSRVWIAYLISDVGGVGMVTASAGSGLVVPFGIRDQSL